MTLVRMVVRPDGRLAVMMPAEAVRRTIATGMLTAQGEPMAARQETDAEFYPRVFAELTTANGFEGLPYADMDPADLPPRTRICDRDDCDAVHGARDGWRWVNGEGVTHDPEAPNPLLIVDHAGAALKGETDPARRGQIEALLADAAAATLDPSAEVVADLRKRAKALLHTPATKAKK